jgi:hypothetical protein
LQKQGGMRIFTLLFFPLALYCFDAFYYQDEIKAQFPPLQKQIDDLVKFNKAKEKFVNDIKQFEKEGQIIQEKINKITFLNTIRGHEIEIHKFFQKSLPISFGLMSWHIIMMPQKQRLVLVVKSG